MGEFSAAWYCTREGHVSKGVFAGGIVTAMDVIKGSDNGYRLAASLLEIHILK